MAGYNRPGPEGKPERNAAMWRMRYGEHRYSYAEIGRHFGVSKNRALRVVKREQLRRREAAL